MTEIEFDDLKRTFHDNTDKTAIMYIPNDHTARIVSKICDHGTIWCGNTPFDYEFMPLQNFALVTRLG